MIAALCDASGIVQNIIAVDDKNAFTPPEGLALRTIGALERVAIGVPFNDPSLHAKANAVAAPIVRVAPTPTLAQVIAALEQAGVQLPISLRAAANPPTMPSGQIPTTNTAQGE